MVVMVIFWLVIISLGMVVFVLLKDDHTRRKF